MAAAASVETDIQVRFRDVDSMHHVNNAVYATYLEQARAAFYDEVVGEPLTDVDTVLVTLTIDYRAPIELGDRVTVTVEVPELGESAIPMEYEITLEDGTVAATAESVQVAFDREVGTSRPIPEAWRRAIESNDATTG